MRAQLVVMVGVMALGTTAIAENFRVTTEISDGQEVRQKSNTIFYQGRVFDVSDPSGKEFIVYDPTQKRIRLINTKRNIQTQLPTSDIEKFTAQIKLLAPQVKRRFPIDPEFKDESTDELIRLTSEYLSYEAELTEPKFPQAAREYLRFADWMTQLNAMNPKALPPFARMQLNKALGDRNVLPLAVRLQLGEQVLSSKHRYFWTISRQDRELCERIGGYLADPKITIVNLGEYRAAQVALKR